MELEGAEEEGEARREGRERSVVDDAKVCANQPDRRVGISFILEWECDCEIEEEEGEPGGLSDACVWA